MTSVQRSTLHHLLRSPAQPKQLEGKPPSLIRDGDSGRDLGTGFGGNHLHYEGPGGANEVVDTDRSAAQTMV